MIFIRFETILSVFFYISYFDIFISLISKESFFSNIKPWKFGNQVPSK